MNPNTLSTRSTVFSLNTMALHMKNWILSSIMILNIVFLKQSQNICEKQKTPLSKPKNLMDKHLKI